jgi:hypothetical protein
MRRRSEVRCVSERITMSDQSCARMRKLAPKILTRGGIEHRPENGAIPS